MIEIKRDSLDERILKTLMECYPITVAELQKELNLSKNILLRRIRSLQRRGILTLDVLPDKSFIRLLRTDFHFVGTNVMQRRALKRKHG
ncbi:MAG: Lrp/AsnC family transcriptional regulator [Methanocellales archaeon]|nr:Lrp/AsnC family transcriptional regulator [Methanocellales archaeon]